MRLVRGIASLAVLLALLLVPPWLLLRRGVTVPLEPDAWLRPDDGTVLLSLLTIVGWLAWVVLAAAVVVEVVGRARGVRVRLPGLGWAQGVAGTLVVAVIGLLPTPSASAAPVPPAVQAPRVVAAALPEAAPAAPRPTSPRWATHVVVRGDNLWDIAEKHYGDGLRWRAIYDANRTVVRDPNLLEPGWELVLPGIPAERGAPASAASTGASAAEVPPDREPAGATSPTPEPTPTVSTRRPERDVEPVADPGSALPGPPVAEASLDAGHLADTEGLDLAPLALGVGAFLGAGLLAGARARRALRDRARPPGRRFVGPSAPAARLEAVVAAQATSLTRDDLLAAQRAIAAHCRRAVLPVLDHVRLGETIRFEMASDPGDPPVGFRREGRAWVVDRRGVPYLATDSRPAWPSLVTVGRAGDDWLLVDPAERPVGVAGDAAGVLAAWLVELACGDVRVATTPALREVVRRAGLESVDVHDSPLALARWAERRASQTAGTRREDRLDPDLAPALEPVVVLLSEEPSPAVGAALRRSCDVAGLGLAMPGAGAVALVVDGAPRLVTASGTVPVEPQRLDAPGLEAVTDLLENAADAPTERAPWWSDPQDTDTLTWLHPRDTSAVAAHKENPVTDPPSHPTLLLLGPIELLGARGAPPAKAPKQCVEYAAWLLEHPGATASQMADSLLVAEGTRRSNMSRLRRWLGTDDVGTDYLPDAYSGRIVLDERVTSDWQLFCRLVAPGVDRVAPATLAEALRLVRGAPLADAAPTQWYWAEPLRSDMRAAIRDAGLRLAEAALACGDHELVRWATARALAAAPSDEPLICARIRAEHRDGNPAEVERLVLRMTQQARILGVDLAEETVLLIQEVTEGAARARRAWT